MKFGLYYFITKDILKHFPSFMLRILILVLGLALIGISFLLSSIYSYENRLLDVCFHNGADQCLMVQIPHTDEGTALSAAIESLPEVYGFGSYDLYQYWAEGTFEGETGSTLEKRIAANQEKKGYNMEVPPEDSGNILELIVFNKNALEITNLELSEGTYPKELRESNTEENICYIYLGWDYRDVPLGTEFTFGDCQAVVAGICKKNSKLFNFTALSWRETAMGYEFDVDDLVLAVWPDSNVSANAIISFEDGIDIQAEKEKILELAQEYNAKTENCSILQSRGTGLFRFYQIQTDRMKKMFWVVIFGVTALYICFSFLVAIQSRRTFSIWLMDGMERRELRNVIRIQNVLCLGTATIFSIWIALGSLRLLTAEAADYKILMTVFFKGPLELMVGYAVLLCILSSVSVGKWLDNMSVLKMYKGV